MLKLCSQYLFHIAFLQQAEHIAISLTLISFYLAFPPTHILGSYDLRVFGVFHF